MAARVWRIDNPHISVCHMDMEDVEEGSVCGGAAACGQRECARWAAGVWQVEVSVVRGGGGDEVTCL